jgi:hypothetical protein
VPRTPTQAEMTETLTQLSDAYTRRDHETLARLLSRRLPRTKRVRLAAILLTWPGR